MAADRAWGTWVRVLRYGGSALLVASVLAFVVLSRHWPVVNDAALMHYIVLLQQHGMAPYLAIRDINLPGAYLPDWLVMKASGGGQLVDDGLAWRLYDFALLAAAAAAMVVIAYPQDWFGGLFGGGLFALFHGRDGIGQAGQRDLAMAVLYLLGFACFVLALDQEQASPIWPPAAGTRTTRTTIRRDAQPPKTAGRKLRLRCFLLGGMGLSLGAATTIKPFGLVYFALLLGWAWSLFPWRKQAPGGPANWPALCSAVAGFALPLAVAACFLLREHAMASFLSMCRISLPYHASVGHWPIAGMFLLAAPASLLKLSVLAGIIALLRRGLRRRVSQALLLGSLLGSLLGLLCFFVQDKGYSYQRYPYLIFVLPWIGMECTAAVRDERWLLRLLGTAGLLFGIFGCAPAYLRAAHRAAWQEPYLEAMEQDIRREAGEAGVASLQGKVQCVDSISGCVNVLYRLRLKQATGTVYDEFLFPQLGRGRVLPPAVVDGREAFLRGFAEQPPQVFLIASWLFPEGPGDYRKLSEWPVFLAYLTEHYRMVDEQVFPRAENGPLGFRMYVRR